MRLLFLFVIILPLMLACNKDNENSQNICDCYEYHEEIAATSSLPIILEWQFTYETIPQPDLCEKETGNWIYYGNNDQFRYKVYCD